MSIQAAISSHLRHDSRVAWLVGERVFRTFAPQRFKGAVTPYPYITYQKVTELRERHFTAAAGLVSAGIQIDCWSKDSNEVLEVADAIRRSLDGLNHKVIGRAPDNATIKAAFLTSSVDDFEEPTEADNRGIFRVIMTWDIWHTETIPELAV